MGAVFGLDGGDGMLGRIDRVRVRGFKSIEALDLELGGVNVLIGANGAGKSNFLALLTLVSCIGDGGLREFVLESGGADALLRYGRESTDKIEIELEIGATDYRWLLGGDMDGGLIIETGSVVGDGGWEVGSLDVANLGARLYSIRQASLGHYRNIVETVGLVVPQLEDFVLRGDLEGEIEWGWREKGVGVDWDVRSLSGGTLRFIGLATLLLQPNLPAAIILDEPELGLHPYAIRLLAGMLQEASLKSQIFVATQSVTLVNQLEAEEICGKKTFWVGGRPMKAAN